jgi:putative polysaccharide biosynthesis protein
MGSLRELGQFGTSLVRSLGDPRRKNAAQMIKEMSLFALRNGLDPRRYVYSLLFARDREDYLLYLSSRKYRHLRKIVTRKHIVPILENKVIFQAYFEQKGLSLPKYIGHTDCGVFIGADREVVPLASPATLKALAESLLERHDKSVFAKPLLRYGGAGAIRVTAESNWTMLFEAITQENYIFQEDIKQHEEIRRMYPHSLNTLRVTTCMPIDSNAVIACARMRFGRGGNHVDNGSKGGFFAGVDLETGRLCTGGLTAMQRSGEFFEVHPDTKVPIKGFCLPDFSAALDLVRRATEALPYPLVGWDVGFTPTGPVLTEGNHNPDYFDDEIASGPYAANRVLGPFIDELTGGRGL